MIMKWLITNWSLLHARLSSQPLNPPTCILDLYPTSSLYLHKSVVILARPPTVQLFFEIINRSFRCASPHFWNELPVSLRQSRITSNQSSSLSTPSSSPRFVAIHELWLIDLQFKSAVEHTRYTRPRTVTQVRQLSSLVFGCYRG